MTFIILKDFLGSFHKKTFPSFYFLLANVVNRETEKYDVNDRWKLVRRHHSKKNINGGPKQKKNPIVMPNTKAKSSKIVSILKGSLRGKYYMKNVSEAKNETILLTINKSDITVLPKQKKQYNKVEVIGKNEANGKFRRKNKILS